MVEWPRVKALKAKLPPLTAVFRDAVASLEKLAYMQRILLTSADALRLWLIAGPRSERKLAASAFVPPTAAARTKPTVMPPSFDMLEEQVGTVYRYALRLTGKAELAEDLAQETLLRAWRSRAELRDERVARVWLLRIATNLWTDELRRGRLRPRILKCEPPCTKPTPAIAANEKENVKLALAAMDRLPHRQRQVLYLISCEGLSQSEVSKVLGIGLPAVKASLSLARKEMRRRLSDVYDELCGRRPCREIQ